MKSETPLVVGINARLEGGQPGGIEQIVTGIASGLSTLEGPERYVFLVHPDHQDWLRSHLAGPCSLLVESRAAAGGPWTALKRGLPRPLKAALRNLRPVRVGASPGALESAGAEVIHFPYQDGFLTTVPTVYQCHDLQHRYYPQFFSRAELRWRDVTFGTLGRQAAVTFSMTRYGKRDLVDKLGLDADRVAVFPGGSNLSAYAEGDAAADARLRHELGLPDRFVLYPAQTWPHKNHRGLARALVRLRDQGLAIQAVCPGRRNDQFDGLDRDLRRLGARDLFVFPGYLEGPRLKPLYRMATALVFPSLFEGWGLPVTEALDAGLPVACARATALPEQVGEAALLFDPQDPDDMAAAIRRLWTDGAERERLARLGRERVSRLTWARAARILRAWYRRLAGRPLDAGDRALVAESLDDQANF